MRGVSGAEADERGALVVVACPVTCGAQKQHPSLSSLLREPIFVMQTTEHGSLSNPVPDRQPVSVLVGGTRSEMGSGRPGPNAAWANGQNIQIS